MDEAHPLLAFDAETGNLLAQRRYLPGRSLWLLYAPEVELRTEAPDELWLRERLPQLPWGWRDWQAYEVDLSDVSVLTLRTSRHIREISVVAEHSASQPELVAGVWVNLQDLSVPLYVGEPPCLRIPWHQADLQSARLSRWRIKLSHEGEAEPPCRIDTALDRFAHLLRRGTDGIELPLSHPSLLGPSPMGQYRLRLRGPLGSKADLRFRVVPMLSVSGHDRLYLPDARQGALPVQLFVETDAQTRLDLLQHVPGLHIEVVAEDSKRRRYRVSIPPRETEAPLRLVRDFSPAHTVYIPLRVPIRRLRWLLVLRPEQLVHQDWKDQAIPVSLEEIEQSEYPYLLLDIPGAENGILVWLRLLDVDDNLLQELEIPSTSRSSRFRRLDLRLIRDILRQSLSLVIKAELVIHGLPDHSAVRLPVLVIRPRVCLRQVTVVPQWNGSSLRLKFTWQPPVPLRRHYIRFWSQTRPWMEPVEVAIPDGARGSYTVQLASEVLPTGEYLIELTAYDPWLQVSSFDRPVPGDDKVFPIALGVLEHRVQQVSELIAHEGSRFDLLAERALLRRRLGDFTGAEKDLQECFSHPCMLL